MDYKIVYFAFVSDNYGGVEQKIIAQFDALRLLGAKIQLFLVSSFSPAGTLNFEIEKRHDVNILINSPSKVNNSWARRKEKFNLISSVLSEYNSKTTIVYFRYPLADILFLRFLKKNKAFKIITEHQDIENMLRLGIFKGNLVQDIFDIIYGKKIRNHITGFVGVSTQYLGNQLGYLKSNMITKKYYMVNGNGVDISKFPLRKYPHFDGQILKLLFIGSGYKPQGLDRLLISLEKYQKQSPAIEIIVHVAGISKDKTYLTKFLANPLIRKSVFFHGFIQPQEIDQYADECHLAVNSISVHREGQKITSTLKSREYFARGIPYITSSSDDDIADENPYIIKVSGNDNPLDIQKLIDFAYKLNDDAEHPQKMRQYAIKNLSWSVKMKKLVTFFDKIMEDIHE